MLDRITESAIRLWNTETELWIEIERAGNLGFQFEYESKV